jgi:carbamoyl-phosphate synthase small subunit
VKAKLILENGMVFDGRAFGYLQETVGEVVFNTGMTGYQEILTDPSYYGQIVCMTYPMIGNYGLNLEDIESPWPAVKGFIIREACDYPSNFRCEMKLDDYLRNHKIMALQKK